MDKLTAGGMFGDRYRVVGELGSGSFGRVYQATQLSTGQPVAIKVLARPPDTSAAELRQRRERFEREMRLCASLSHPNVVRLLDSGEVDETLYAVFEYLAGPTLRETLETQGRLEIGETVHLMTQVLDALACAHEQGVVHRDLKPENIMITKTGARRNAMVLDFGLAGFSREAAAQRAARLTATHEMIGTPAYAAPEQLRGEPPSPRSDLYSWGLVALECLSGSVVMNGRTAYEAMMMQLGPDPVSVPVWLRDRPLGRLLATVVSKDPADRRVTTATLLESLDAIVRRGSERDTAPRLPPATGERRQVTVVACELLVARRDRKPVDLEDLDQVERGRLATYERIARAEGGTLARPLPGRLLAVFGYPRAHENDARRAIRVAELIAAESRMLSAGETGALLTDVRSGVHSGLGIVRLEPPGSDGQAWCQVVGAPLHVASRLQERASAGEILVTEDTRVLLRDEMACTPAGSIDSSDRAEPVELMVYRVTGRRPATARSPTRRRETPLAGRAVEVAQLEDLWRGAEAGEAGVVLVQGEAGIGKSRLLREVSRSVPPEAWLECRCVLEDRASPLRPIVDLLLSLPTSIEDALAHYEFDLPSTVPLFATLLRRPCEKYPPLKLAPEVEKELTLKAIVAMFLRMAGESPLVLAVEDLHWADPTTLEFLAQLVGECRGAQVAGGGTSPRLLLALTARQRFEPPWDAADVAHIALGRLRLREVEQMVNADRSRDSMLPGDLITRIAERTDGIPLFVEELVHVLGSPKEGIHASDQRLIPGPLRELLAARLDGLSASAYETAQVAAALGREFSYELLEIVAERGEKPSWMVRQDLAELLDAKLLYERSTANAYVFKHALVRDATYDSMVRDSRRDVHRRIADSVLERLPELAEQRPELVAHHLFEANDAFAASEYWQLAGDSALRRAAYKEAAEHLEHGLAAVRSVTPGRDRDARELDLLITLGTLHFSTKGYAALEVGETFGKARQIYDRVGGEVAPLKIFSGLYSMYVTRGDRAEAEALLPRFEALVDDGDAVAASTGLLVLSIDAFFRGDHERATAQLERGRDLYATDQFRRFAEQYGWDGGLFIHGYSVWNSAIAGRHDEAEHLYRHLLRLAQASADPYAPPLALAFGMAASHARRDPTETLARAHRLIEVSNEQRAYLWLAIGQCGAGWATALQQDPRPGIDQLREGLELCRVIGAMTPYGYYLTFLTAALLESGDVDAGLAAATEGLELCAQGLARVHEPELERLMGELLIAAGKESEGQRHLRDALDSARQRAAGAWALRASTALARLLAGAGATSAAAEVLNETTQAFPDAATRADRADIASILDR